MAEIVALSLLLAAAFVALFNWRMGLLFCVFVGFAQDPLRKLLPPHPGYFIVLVGVAFGFVYLSVALHQKNAFRLRHLYAGDRRMAVAWQLFILLVLLQAVNALLHFGNPLLFMFGGIMYLGPIFALLVVYAYADSLMRIQKFLNVYSFFGVIWGISVYLSYWFGENWPALWEIGTFFGKEIIIYDIGTAFGSYSGLFRVGEIAAWHAATTICFLVIMAITRGSLLYRIWVGILCAVLVGAIILTGRRKMLMGLVIFASVYWFLLALLGRGALKMGLAVLIVGISIAVMGNLLFNDSGQQMYLQRGVTVFSTESLQNRLNTTINLFYSAYSQGGLLGIGAGAASQGARFVGQTKMYGASEAGIGRVILEFGLLGFLILGWFLWRLSRYLWHLLKYTQRNNPKLGVISLGFAAFLVANAATFIVASQLYGDFFVLLMLGIVMGFLFAMPKVMHLQMQANMPRSVAISARPESTCLSPAQ